MARARHRRTRARSKALDNRRRWAIQPERPSRTAVQGLRPNNSVAAHLRPLRDPSRFCSPASARLPIDARVGMPSTMPLDPRLLRSAALFVVAFGLAGLAFLGLLRVHRRRLSRASASPAQPFVPEPARASARRVGRLSGGCPATGGTCAPTRSPARALLVVAERSPAMGLAREAGAVSFSRGRPPSRRCAPRPTSRDGSLAEPRGFRRDASAARACRGV